MLEFARFSPRYRGVLPHRVEGPGYSDRRFFLSTAQNCESFVATPNECGPKFRFFRQIKFRHGRVPRLSTYFSPEPRVYLWQISNVQEFQDAHSNFVDMGQPGLGLFASESLKFCLDNAKQLLGISKACPTLI